MNLDDAIARVLAAADAGQRVLLLETRASSRLPFPLAEAVEAAHRRRLGELPEADRPRAQARFHTLVCAAAAAPRDRPNLEPYLVRAGRPALIVATRRLAELAASAGAEVLVVD